MKETYTAEQIESVPSKEIARHLARIVRLDLALEDNDLTDGRTTSDWGSEDGRIIGMIADKSETIDDIRSDPRYDEGVLFELQQWRFKYAIRHLPKEYRAAKKAQIIDYSSTGPYLAVDGFKRVGEIFEEDARAEIIPTIGAYAAFAFQRKNIDKETDRLLYGRAPEIKEARSAIEDAVPVRLVGKSDPRFNRYWQRRSVFTYDSSMHDRSVDWWWSELSTDLSAIDEVVKSL